MADIRKHQSEADHTNEGVRRGDNNAVHQGAQGAASAIERGVHLGSEMVRQTGKVEAQALRQSGSVAGTLAYHASEATVDGSRRMVDDAATHIEEVGRSLADAVQGMADDIRLMLLPASANGGLQEMQRALGGLVEGVVHSNLRATQELFRFANPGAAAQLQARFVREYLDALVEGQTSIFRAMRHAADETLRPLEQQLEERRQRSQDHHQRQQHRGSRVADVMTRGVRVASPEDTVQQAARVMREEDTGVLPVGENDRLVGMVTDRDVAVRVAAEGKNPAQTRVREVMTPEVRYVFEDEDLHRAADVMAEQQVRRLPVVNRNKRLVGVVSLGDLAAEGHTPRLAGRALAGAAREGNHHNQAAAE